MKKTVFIGVLLVAFSIIYPFTPEGTSVSVNLDLLPDFLGFIFIFMGLDKLQYYNKRMRDVSAFAVFFAVVSFITFISQLYPFYLSSLIQTNEYGVQLNPLYFLGYAAVFVNNIYAGLEYVFMGVYLMFISYFCIAVASELSHRGLRAEDKKEFSRKDAYGDIYFSKRAYKIFTYISYVFAALYFAAGILYFINQGLKLSIDILGSGMGLWIVLLPLHILFAAYLLKATAMTDGMREEDIPKDPAEEIK